MTNKTILLTGATGFLGSHLAHEMVSQGYRVIAIKRRNSKLDRVIDIAPQMTLLDVEDLNWSVLENSVGIDAVVHTATCYGRKKETIAELVDANTVFPLRLLDFAIKAKVKLFINSGTVLAAHTNAYALSKSQFVEWGKLLVKSEKMCFVNLRLEHIYGAGDDITKFTTHVVQSCLANVPEIELTPGEQKRDFIYIDDAVSAYLSILHATNSLKMGFNEYDLGSGSPITVREFVEKVKQITNSATRLQFGAIPYRLNEMMESSANTAALEALGWKCRTSLTEGIKKIVSTKSARK